MSERIVKPELVDGIEGGDRCAIVPTRATWQDWWFGVSPRNGPLAAVEGYWSDWVNLARKIIAIEDAGGPYQGERR